MPFVLFVLLASCSLLAPPSEVDNGPQERWLLLEGPAVVAGDYYQINSGAELRVSLANKDLYWSDYFDAAGKLKNLADEQYYLRWRLLDSDDEIVGREGYQAAASSKTVYYPGDDPVVALVLANTLPAGQYRLQFNFYLGLSGLTTSQVGPDIIQSFELLSPPLLSDLAPKLAVAAAVSENKDKFQLPTDINSAAFTDLLFPDPTAPAQGLISKANGQKGYKYTFGPLQIRNVPAWVERISLQSNDEMLDSQTLGKITDFSNYSRFVRNKDNLVILTQLLVGLEAGSTSGRVTSKLLTVTMSDAAAQKVSLEICFSIYTP